MESVQSIKKVYYEQNYQNILSIVKWIGEVGELHTQMLSLSLFDPDACGHGFNFPMALGKL